MTPFVVDTNVAIVANGGHCRADVQCREACIKKLKDICDRQVVVIDKNWLILKEYTNRLDSKRAQGMGHMFLKHVFNYQSNESRVRQVSITPSEDDRRGFEELPDNRLDRADRKFLAAAIVSQATIVNAVDSDWIQQEALTQSLGVAVQELCPHMLKTEAATPRGSS